MSYTNQTTHYGLPLPTGSDKSTWLDTNEAFQAVDAALYAAAQGSGSASSAISTLQSQMSTANANIATNAAAITAEETARTTADTAHSNAISAINTKLGTTSLQGHGDGTVTGVVSDLVEGYDEFVTGHTPVDITINQVSTTNFHIEGVSMTVDDYFINWIANVDLQGAVPVSASGISGKKEIVLGTVSATQVNQHFAHLEADTYYILGNLITRRPSMGYTASSGDASPSTILSMVNLCFYIHAGTGYIAITCGNSDTNWYGKILSTSSNKYVDTTSNMNLRGRGTVMRSLSVHVPDPE